LVNNEAGQSRTFPLALLFLFIFIGFTLPLQFTGIALPSFCQGFIQLLSRFQFYVIAFPNLSSKIKKSSHLGYCGIMWDKTGGEVC